jgi:hypothetical protein
MPNRREFLQTGAVASAVAMNGLFIPSGFGAGALRPHLPQLVVYDDRYPEAREIAASIAAPDAAVRTLVNGDVTSLYQELDLLWKTRSVAIAGVTQFGPMFVLERLGADRGMRVARRIECREASPLSASVAQQDAASPIHYYVPHAVQQGQRTAVDGPLYSWLIASNVLSAEHDGKPR